MFDFGAHKEKLLKEQIVITSVVNESKTLTIVLHARVLGILTS